MVPPQDSVEITSVVGSAYSPQSIEVLGKRTDPATDSTVLDLEVALQTVSPFPGSQIPPELPPIATEIGRVDYLV